jgi:hypothetical protein
MMFHAVAAGLAGGLVLATPVALCTCASARAFCTCDFAPHCAKYPVLVRGRVPGCSVTRTTRRRQAPLRIGLRET